MKQKAVRILIVVSAMLGLVHAAPLPVLEAKRVISAPNEGWDYFFGSCSWYCGAPGIRVAASSSLTERDGLSHPPKQAHDSKMDKVWSEGVEGAGIGEKLTFTFVTTKKDTVGLGVSSCAIAIGHQASEALFQQNARPKVLKLRMDGVPKAVLELNDAMGLQWFDLPKLVLERPSEHTISLEIVEVYPGTRFEDTCIAEVYFQGTGRMH